MKGLCNLSGIMDMGFEGGKSSMTTVLADGNPHPVKFTIPKNYKYLIVILYGGAGAHENCTAKITSGASVVVQTNNNRDGDGRRSTFSIGVAKNVKKGDVINGSAFYENQWFYAGIGGIARAISLLKSIFGKKVFA